VPHTINTHQTYTDLTNTKCYETLKTSRSHRVSHKQMVDNFFSRGAYFVCEFTWFLPHFKSRDSSVGVALGYRLDDRDSRVRFPAAAGNFSLHHRVQNGSGTPQPPIQWVPGALSLGYSGRGMKLTTHIHLVPRSRMRGAIPPLPQYAFMAWCLVKHRDKFTFTFILPYSFQLSKSRYCFRS
jgi:hypothetical protein